MIFPLAGRVVRCRGWSPLCWLSTRYFLRGEPTLTSADRFCSELWVMGNFNLYMFVFCFDRQNVFIAPVVSCRSSVSGCRATPPCACWRASAWVTRTACWRGSWAEETCGGPPAGASPQLCWQIWCTPITGDWSWHSKTIYIHNRIKLYRSFYKTLAVCIYFCIYENCFIGRKTKQLLL